MPKRFPSGLPLVFLCCLVLGLLPQLGTAQISYEPGYLVGLDGKREDVAIRYQDWRFHPATITIRDAAGRERDVATDSVTEFGAPGVFTYRNVSVLIEKSTTALNSLDYQPRKPQRSRELLRVEVDGPTTLYSYRQPGVTKLFLQQGEVEPTLLVYYVFSPSPGVRRESKSYIMQLNAALSCLDQPANDRTPYHLNEIAALVRAQNTCSTGAEATQVVSAGMKARALSFAVLPGAYLARFRVVEPAARENGLGTVHQPVFRLGVEAEYRLPFGRDKYALLFSPSIYRFTSEGTFYYYPLARPAESGSTQVKFTALDIPVGIRYFAFLNPRTQLFAEGAVGIRLLDGPPLEIGRHRSFEYSTGFTGMVGLGLRTRDRYQLSARYQVDTNTLRSQLTVSKSGGLWLALGYRL